MKNNKKKIKSNLVPFVIEKDGLVERSYDIYSRLLNDRIIFINSEINDELAGSVCAQLLHLEAENSEAIISLYINSPGGSIDSGLAIVDTMEYIRAPVSTISFGSCSSMASVILACGEKGKRFALPHSRIMIHQPYWGIHGTITDMQIHMKEGEEVKKILNEILSEKTGKKISQIKKDVERDRFMSSKEALEYGIIDKIIKKNI